MEYQGKKGKFGKKPFWPKWFSILDKDRVFKTIKFMIHVNFSIFYPTVTKENPLKIILQAWRQKNWN